MFGLLVLVLATSTFKTHPPLAETPMGDIAIEERDESIDPRETAPQTKNLQRVMMRFFFGGDNP